MAKSTNTGEPSWFYRRWYTVINTILSWAALYYMSDNPDTMLNRGIVEGLVWYMVFINATYLLGSTASEMMATFVTRSGRPYADAVQSAPPPPPDQTVVVAQTNVQQPQKPPVLD